MKLIELTPNEGEGSKKVWINAEYIISIMENTFTVETKILFMGGIVMGFKEPANKILSLISATSLH